jgi:hypothetical protein
MEIKNPAIQRGSLGIHEIGPRGRPVLFNELEVSCQWINHTGKEKDEKHCLFEDHIGTP